MCGHIPFYLDGHICIPVKYYCIHFKILFNIRIHKRGFRTLYSVGLSLMVLWSKWFFYHMRHYLCSLPPMSSLPFPGSIAI